MANRSERPGSDPGVRRYAAERALPPYAFIPGGGTPHPRRDPAGHAFGRNEPAPEPLDPERWQQSVDYRFAVDLFNHGYYWEAHEVLEGLWVAAGKCGPAAELCQGLIKLAAAGVKVRQGMVDGARRHARRAARHLDAVHSSIGAPSFAGLDLATATALAREIEAGVEGMPRCRGESVAVVLPRVLSLESGPLAE